MPCPRLAFHVSDTTLTPPQRLRGCLLRHGRSATDFQIVNPGFVHWFSHHLDAVAGYVDVASFRVVAGVPVCEPPYLLEAMRELEADARVAGRQVCYFGVESWAVEHLTRESGYATVLLGGQPSWDPLGWADIFVQRASLRAQLNRARNKAVQVEEQPVVTAHQLEDLHACLESWLQSRGLPPMRFLVQPETLAALHDRRLFVARRDGGVVGFLVLSPVPQRKGWLVEQIVRGSGAVNGTAELMLDTAVRALADEGARYVTLGLAALSRRSGLDYGMNPFWLRCIFNWTRAHGSRFYNFKGLDAFKAKFSPDQWEPLYAVANCPHFSPRAFYAIASAFSEGAPFRLVTRACLKAVRTETRWMLDWVLSRNAPNVER